MMLMMKMSADIEFFNIYAIKVAAKIALCCGWCQRGRGNNGCKRRAASNYMPLARSLSPLLARAPLHKFYTQKTKPKWIISCKLRIQIFLIFLLKKKNNKIIKYWNLNCNKMLQTTQEFNCLLQELYIRIECHILVIIVLTFSPKIFAHPQGQAGKQNAVEKIRTI